MKSDNLEKVLVVECDPLISDLVANQALAAAGYQVKIASDMVSAIQIAKDMQPDVIITNLALPGLSGKDLIIALSSQNIETSVVIISNKGREAEVIQAYRLGVSDYLLWPFKEPEVLTVMDRVFRQVRARKERIRLRDELERTNNALRKRIRDMGTIFSIGKAITQISDQVLLFDRILEGAIQVARADKGWLLLKNENDKKFLLVAHHQMPESVASYLNQPWNDGISSMVAMSGKNLTIHGDLLARYKISSFGQAALVIPIKVADQVVGILTVMRKNPFPFAKNEEMLLSAISDYASISLINARLFQTVEDQSKTSDSSQQYSYFREKISCELLTEIKREMKRPLETAWDDLEALTDSRGGRWSSGQQQIMKDLSAQLNLLEVIKGSISSNHSSNSLKPQFELNEAVQQALNRFLNVTKYYKFDIQCEYYSEPLIIQAEPTIIQAVLDGLLSNAVKYSYDRPGNDVLIRIEKYGYDFAMVTIKDKGVGIPQKALADLFEIRDLQESSRKRNFGSIGISLVLIDQIIKSLGGTIGVERELNSGATFFFTLPLTIS
ncbi:MAG: response regulator [Anaerolineaceae bacterium]|nr:response regulator [Anaerolineaceae bacterium]